MRGDHNRRKRKRIGEHLRGGRGVGKRDQLWWFQQVNDALALILEGKPERDIRLFLGNKYQIGPHRVGEILGKAREELAGRLKLEARHLVTLHLHRYEDLYARLMDLNALPAALEVLKYKEALLGFHRANFALRVSGGRVQQVHLAQERPEYDVTRLPNERRARFEELLAKLFRKPERLAEVVTKTEVVRDKP